MADRRATFVRTYLPAAKAASAATGIDPGLILAQAAHESAWGRRAPGNNFFGIKGRGQSFATHEYVGGKRVNTSASFRRYDSPEDSFMDWAKMMHNPKWAAVRAATTPEDQAKALKAAGYATDPRYVSKLLSVRNQVSRIAGPLLSGVYDPLSGQIVQPGMLPVDPNTGLDTAGQNPEITNLIKEQQQVLKDNGYYDGPVDGIDGPMTRAAAKAAMEAGLGDRLTHAAAFTSEISAAPVDANPMSDIGLVAGLTSEFQPQSTTMAAEPPRASPSPSDQFENVVGYMPQFAQPYAMPSIAAAPPDMAHPPIGQPARMTGTATTGQGMGAEATAPAIQVSPPAPRSRPPQPADSFGKAVAKSMAASPFTLAGGEGSDLSAGVADTLTPVPTERPPSPISGSSGGDLIAGNAGALPPTPRSRPTIASVPASVTEARVKDDAYTPATPPPAEPEIPGTLFAAPGDTMAEQIAPDMDPASIARMGNVSKALPTGIGGTMATSPPDLEPEPTPEPIMVSAPAPAPAPVQTHRPVTPSQPQPMQTMATSSPAAGSTGGGVAGWFSRILTPNTGGSRSFAATGPSGVSPGGYKYQTGGNRIGSGGTYVTPSGRTITYVQDDHFGQPGYLTGYG